MLLLVWMMHSLQRSEWKLHRLAAREHRGYFIEDEIEKLHRLATRQPPLPQLVDYISLVQSRLLAFHRRSGIPKTSPSASIPILGCQESRCIHFRALSPRARKLEFIDRRDRATVAPYFGHAQGCNSRSPASFNPCTIVYGSRFAGQSLMASQSLLKWRFTRFSLPKGNSTSLPRFRAWIIRDSITFTISTDRRRDRPRACSFPTR